MKIIKKTYPFTIIQADKVLDGFTDNFDYDGLVKKIFDEKLNKWVEAATPEEIEAFHQAKQQEYINQLNEKFKSDGLEYQRQIKNRVTAQLAGRENVIPILAEINKTVYTLLNKIAAGDWALAMIDYLDNENNPTIQEVKALFDEVGQKAIKYYNEEYPH